MANLSITSTLRIKYLWLATGVIILFIGCLLVGTVSIPLGDVMKTLFTGSCDNKVWDVIILGSRIPCACTALIAGAALAVSGLMMQTTFDNPLAGPSVLGVSTGSSLGVAIVLLALGGTVGGISRSAAVLIGAFAGAMLVLVILLGFSRIMRNTAVLLIVGIMVGYLASSAVSLLNFFSTQEGVHSFVIWGMGSFSGLTLGKMTGFAIIIAILLVMSFMMIKPLDAMLLGENYAANLGIRIQRTRSSLLLISGALTAVVTAYCGPIGFIGLVVPHIARYITGTSRHGTTLPATALIGAGVALFCVFVSTLPSRGIIPINAITPIIGVPVIIYILVRRHD